MAENHRHEEELRKAVGRCRSAELHSAVSRICNPPSAASSGAYGKSNGLPTASRRYSRLQICATTWRRFLHVAVSMLMSRGFRRLLFAPVVLGDSAVLDRAGFYELHPTLGTGARLVGNHLGMLGHRTRIKRRGDGNRAGFALRC